jgi:hypothetical protein
MKFSLGKVGVPLCTDIIQGLDEPIRKTGIPFKSRGTDIGQIVGNNICPEEIAGHIPGNSGQVKFHDFPQT